MGSSGPPLSDRLDSLVALLLPYLNKGTLSNCATFTIMPVSYTHLTLPTKA